MTLSKALYIWAAFLVLKMGIDGMRLNHRNRTIKALQQFPAGLPDTTSGGLHVAAGSPAHQDHPKFQSPKPAFLSLWPLHKAQGLLPAPTPTQAVGSAVTMVTSKPTR